VYARDANATFIFSHNGSPNFSFSGWIRYVWACTHKVDVLCWTSKQSIKRVCINMAQLESSVERDFPQVRAMVSLVCLCCSWFILAPKVFQLCTNHFVWIVCKPVWVSETCQLFLVPSWSSNTPLYPSKCCELLPIPPSFAIFYLDSHLNPSRSWECVIIFVLYI